MKKFLQNIVKLKEISTIKDFRFGTFPSISGSGSGYTFYRPPYNIAYFRCLHNNLNYPYLKNSCRK